MDHQIEFITWEYITDYGTSQLIISGTKNTCYTNVDIDFVFKNGDMHSQKKKKLENFFLIAVKKIPSLIPPLIIFLFALLLRRLFFSGFILGDDIQEFVTAKHMLYSSPDFNDQFHLRFGVWIYNLLFFKIFGISEFSFFLPTVLMSSSLSIIGYKILTFYGYSRFQSYLAGLFVASAPFEVLIGGLRANDVIFTWLVFLGFLFFILYETKQIKQGVIVSIFLWLAFYVKLWAIFSLPIIILYYAFRFIKGREWYGGVSFLVTSSVLHGITCIGWKVAVGEFLPFIHNHAATYPVETKDLLHTFGLYPRMLFNGSLFKTTLFGYVPYLLLALLLFKSIISFSSSRKKIKLVGFDALDIYLMIFYFSFFLLLNFFPNSFSFDQYYSAPRIFRYLTPISFPIALHTSKMVLDLGKFFFKKSLQVVYFLVLSFSLMIPLNILQTRDATNPGLTYRKNLLEIVRDIRSEKPPQLLVESWLSFFMREVYLKGLSTQIDIVSFPQIHDAKMYEQWLTENQESLQDDAFLITGLCNYVHYGCHNCGFRLEQFEDDLDPRWQLYRTYGSLDYLPIREHANVWRWKSVDE